jgi:hypothetical protein
VSYEKWSRDFCVLVSAREKRVVGIYTLLEGLKRSCGVIESDGEERSSPSLLWGECCLSQKRIRKQERGQVWVDHYTAQ